MYRLLKLNGPINAIAPVEITKQLINYNFLGILSLGTKLAELKYAIAYIEK